MKRIEANKLQIEVIFSGFIDQVKIIILIIFFNKKI